MGFKEVYDYVTGKLDWLAAGLPSDGPLARLPRAGDVARKDVPTCDLSARWDAGARNGQRFSLENQKRPCPVRDR